tara:strand:+ start:41 stop:895 length:855 start_codon:yes stop_codon:yes gene_type:complete
MKSDKKILTALNKMKVQRELWKDKQVKELIKLETLEEKIQYWEVNLKYTSLLLPISNGTDTVNLSLEANSNREIRLLILKAEINRIENTNDLLSRRLREDFVMLASETNNIKLTKKKLIERVSKLIDTDTYKDLHTQMRKLGFETYKGGREPDTIVKELNLLSIGIKHQLMFKDIYEGYKLAELVEDIKTEKKDNTAASSTSNSSPLTAALILKHFGILDYLLNKHSVSNDKAIYLLVNLLNIAKSKSIGSSYRDEDKLNSPQAQKKAIKFLNDNGITTNSLDL